MRRVIPAIAALGCAALVATLISRTAWAADAPAKTDATAKSGASADSPADRVVVMYFHRTKRCPTCLKMGGYAEEAVKTGFAPDLKSGKVEFHYIDFQDEKNKAITKGYNVSGPTLIVAKVVDNKVAGRKNLTEIWAKVRDKAAFLEYVQTNVRDCQN